MECEVLVVILNYKTADLTIQCLESIQDQLNSRHQLIVVDNNSSDGSFEQISSWIASHGNQYMDIINSGKNLGFSGGNNIGINHKQAEFYLLLNSDTIVRQGAINVLIKTAKSHPEAGIISPRLEWPDARPQISCFRFHSPISQFINVAATSYITNILEHWNVPIPVSDNISSPQWTSFACVLMRNTMIKSVGLMDEGYFLYFEDADYCWQARKHGWKIVNNPKARVVHLRGGSSEVKQNISMKKRLPKYYYQSRTRYFVKNFSHFGFLMANLMWIIGRCISKTREVFGKKTVPVCKKEYQDIWTSQS